MCRLHDDEARPVAPEIIARGFAFEGAQRAETLLEDVHTCAVDAIAALPQRETKLLQAHLRDNIAELIYDRSRKRPLVIPVSGAHYRRRDYLRTARHDAAMTTHRRCISVSGAWTD